jgi:hypothetical protein
VAGGFILCQATGQLVDCCDCTTLRPAGCCWARVACGCPTAMNVWLPTCCVCLPTCYKRGGGDGGAGAGAAAVAAWCHESPRNGTLRSGCCCCWRTLQPPLLGHTPTCPVPCLWHQAAVHRRRFIPGEEDTLLLQVAAAGAGCTAAAVCAAHLWLFTP